MSATTTGRERFNGTDLNVDRAIEWLLGNYGLVCDIRNVIFRDLRGMYVNALG